MFSRLRVRPVWVVAALIGCGKSEAPKSADLAPAPVAVPPAAPVEKKPAFEEASFKLVLSGEPTYTAGQPNMLKLGLEARGGYHVNQEFPIRVELTGPAGVKFAKSTLERADASAFGESSAAFPVAFTAESGTHEVVAKVDFAVCTPETCVPDERTLALSIDVK